MSLIRVNAGDTFYINILNQCVNILQVPSGGQETGKYFLEAPAYTSGCNVGWNVGIDSRWNTMVSCSVDTSTLGLTSMTGSGSNRTVAYTNASGFQVWGQSTAANGNCRCGGNYTCNF